MREILYNEFETKKKQCQNYPKIACAFKQTHAKQLKKKQTQKNKERHEQANKQTSKQANIKK